MFYFSFFFLSLHRREMYTSIARRWCARGAYYYYHCWTLQTPATYIYSLYTTRDCLAAFTRQLLTDSIVVVYV